MNCDDNVYSIAAWRMQFALYIVTYNYFACVYRVVLVVLVVFVSKDAIKSVPSNNNHLSPPLAASASCPSSTIRTQLRIKLDDCVCGEASAPIGQMMQIILMRQQLKY